MSAHQPIRHILVAHDLTPNAEPALQYALELARNGAARLSVLHVHDVSAASAAELASTASDWMASIAETARQRLDEVCAEAGAGTVLHPELREGAPWREIDRFAADQDVDLIVMGTHGRRGLPHALLGSVAEKVVRTAPCPVLVVRGTAHA
jgi:nucleotide-binding universal stress UspA family protein